MRVAAPLVLVALLTPALLAPDVAQAQPLPDDGLRLGAHFALAVAGDANASAGNIDTSASLDPTLGGALRISMPLHEYFVLGGFLELLAFEADSIGAEREVVFNLDLLLKARFLVEVSRSFGIEPYAALVVGPSIAVFNDPDGMGDEPWPGWNIGLLGGAALLFAPAGIFFELGWRFHQAFTEAQVLGRDVDFQVHTHQLAMQLGGFIRL